MKLLWLFKSLLSLSIIFGMSLPSFADDPAIVCGSSGTSDSTDGSKDQADCQAVNNISTIVNSSYPQATKNNAAIKAANSDFNSKWKSCISKHDLAANACLDGLSSNLKDVTSALGPIIAAASTASSASGSCSDFSKIMDLANKGLTAFNAACATTKGMCQSTCQGAVDALKKVSTLASSDSCLKPSDAACSSSLETQKTALSNATKAETDNSSNSISSAGKAAMCKDKFAQLMAASAAGIASMIAGMMQGNKCAEATAATATTVDCTDATQAQTPACLCLANPRLQGCDNSLEKLADAKGSGITGSTATTTPVTASAPNLSSDPGMPDIARDPSSAAAASPPGAGGANLGGGSGLGGPGAPTGDAAGGKTLDANILAGTSGGGGGGGGWGAGSGHGADDKNLKSYLPGGAKDPGLAGAAKVGEVTGQGGKSNWEKVRDRYLDNKPSLLNNN